MKTEIQTLGLYQYDDEAWPNAKRRYFGSYKIRGTLADDADEKCRHPLLFRFFCEAYEGENVSLLREIRLKPLFERYLAKKIKKITRDQPPSLHAEEKAVRILLGIATEMLATQETTVKESRIPQLTGDVDHLGKSSLYVRLLDEDIMIEEIPDEHRNVFSRRIRFVYEAFLEFMIAKSLEERWKNLANEQILSSLDVLLEPTACMRNVVGALSYLTSYFADRSLNIWEAFGMRGPVWQNIVVQSIKETDPREIGDLHHSAFKALLTNPDPGTRAAAITILQDPERCNVLDSNKSVLFKSLKHDPNSKVRVAAHEVLSVLWNSLTVSQRYTVAEAAFDKAKTMRIAGKRTIRKLKEKEIAKQDAIEKASMPSKSEIALEIKRDFDAGIYPTIKEGCKQRGIKYSTARNAIHKAACM